jgi:hypothetical protein
MRPVTVEIIAYTPTEFFHCLHCEVVWQQGGVGQKIHAEQRASSLPLDLAEQYADIGAWAAQLQERFGDRLRLRIVDAVSMEGVFKAIRYRLGRLPAIVVDSRDRCDAADLERASAIVARRVEESLPAAIGASGAAS